jgi:hypothetical protein
MRLNGLYLMLSAISGTIMDIRGIYFGTGPEANIVRLAPYSGLGFLEAHLLAFIMGLVLWRAETVRFFHLIGGATVAVLGVCNLFWPVYRKYEAEITNINDDRAALVKEYCRTGRTWQI